MSDAGDEAAFLSRLAGLDPAAFRAFVREVYAHREGHVLVDRGGTPLDASANAEGTRRVYVHHSSEGTLPALDDRVDAVVVPGAGTGVAADTEIAVLDARDLFRVTRYALAPEDGDAVCRRHLDLVPRARRAGRPLGEPGGWTGGAVESSSSRPGAPDSGADAGRHIGLRTLASVGVAALLVGVIVGVGVGSIAFPDTSGDVATPAGTNDVNSPTPTPLATVTVSEVDSPSVPAAAAADIRERYARLEPTCERPPDLVVQLQVNALRHDNGTDAPIETVYRFASPANRQRTRPLGNFVGIVRSDPFEELLEHERAEYGPLVVNGTSARQQVAVTDGDGDTETYLFRLSRQTGGAYEGCWMTDSVEPLIPGT